MARGLRQDPSLLWDGSKFISVLQWLKETGILGRFYIPTGRKGYTGEGLRAIRAIKGVGRPPAVIRARREHPVTRAFAKTHAHFGG